MRTELDDWLADPSIRVTHRRGARASGSELWQAAREVTLDDTPVLGRLVRWRIPGLDGGLAYDRMFREPPFIVLAEDDQSLICGLVGRIWTLRRDYPGLADAEEFRTWSRRGTARVVLATWAADGADGTGVLESEARVQAIGTQGAIGVAAVRPLVRGFQHLIGTEALRAATRRAERG